MRDCTRLSYATIRTPKTKMVGSCPSANTWTQVETNTQRLSRGCEYCLKTARIRSSTPSRITDVGRVYNPATWVFVLPRRSLAHQMKGDVIRTSVDGSRTGTDISIFLLLLMSTWRQYNYNVRSDNESRKQAIVHDTYTSTERGTNGKMR